MTIDQGMNIDEVKALSEQLKAAAARLTQIGQVLQTRVGGTSWVGPDATKFKNDWWPGHRTRLQQLSTDLDGFGQSAANNAAEQEQASGLNSTVGGIGAAVIGAGTIGLGAIDKQAPVKIDVGTAPTVVVPGATPAVMPQGRDWHEVQIGYDKWATGIWANPNQSQYQCTAWANYRWHELGYNGIVGGNGGAMAGNAPGDPSTNPSLHAMASYGAGTNANPGHVMIVEEVLDGGNRIRVSEMNTDRDWQHASASEYSDSRIITRSADGTFHGSNGQLITFAGFPG